MILDLAIIGAGPYGLSIAAHLFASGLSFRIFGSPMQSWRRHMPKGMHLKSDGFASNLYSPGSSFTLRDYCEEKGLPYSDVGLPVPLETFAAYGLEFQKRFVPMLEETEIVSVHQAAGGFELKTTNGETFQARRVVVATGITHFGFLPPLLADLPRESVTHSSEHHDLSGFEGKKVAVIGAGASALDIAALLNEAGAQVELVARRREIAFHTLSREPRPLWQRLRNPRSGLGVGWRSSLCTGAPLLFHAMPQEFRLRVVRNHLGPAPGWFIRDRVVGKFPMHLGAAIEDASVSGSRVHLRLSEKDGSKAELAADHLIAATGYRVSVSKLNFLDPPLRRQIQTVEDSPVLSRSFQTSVEGLYMVGVASANSFGPLTRFAYGAGFTARVVSRHLAARPRTSKIPRAQAGSVDLAID
jgi:cation diffusion facilitator CzcD-associated flavoprotein CzcO